MRMVVCYWLWSLLGRSNSEAAHLQSFKRCKMHLQQTCNRLACTCIMQVHSPKLAIFYGIETKDAVPEKMRDAHGPTCNSNLPGTAKLSKPPLGSLSSPRVATHGPCIHDVSNSGELALQEIARLEHNNTAYMEVTQKETILLEGTATIDKFFAFGDDILPNATLKRNSRKMLLTTAQRNC